MVHQPLHAAAEERDGIHWCEVSLPDPPGAEHAAGVLMPGNQAGLVPAWIALFSNLSNIGSYTSSDPAVGQQNEDFVLQQLAVD